MRLPVGEKRGAEEKIFREIFKKNFEQLSEKYKDIFIPAELAGVIGAITESEFILECKEKGESWNMCKALEEYLETGREQGREQGKIEGMQEGFRKGQEKTLRILVEKGLLTAEQAALVPDISLEEHSEE